MTSREQARTFMKSAELVHGTGDFTSATILYFKTWFALCDVVLLEKAGMAPKDHNERFRMLEKHFPDKYKALDLEFNTYRSTYTRVISRGTCARIRKVVADEASKIL